MIRAPAQYTCIACDLVTDEYRTLCTSCGAEYSFRVLASTSSEEAAKIIVLGRYKPRPEDRLMTGFRPWDELTNGMVRGFTYLIGGNKGLGKSTIVLQLASLVKERALIVSAEEQMESIGQRAARTGVLLTEQTEEKIAVLNTGLTEEVFKAIDRVEPSVVIIDSVNKFCSERSDIGGTFGSVSQIQYLVDRLRAVASERKIINILIGQVTSTGKIAGPNKMQHDVDAVFLMRRDARDKTLRRMIPHKNRGGPTDIETVFKMTEIGLIDPMQGADESYAERVLSESLATGDDGDYFSTGSASSNVIDMSSRKSKRNT